MKTEQIEKASFEYAVKTAEDYCECDSEFVQELMVAFESGARFALSSQWVSVKNALPENNDLVLVNVALGKFKSTVAYYKDDAWHFMDGFYYECEVSHWMPIPKLNAEAEKGESK